MESSRPFSAYSKSADYARKSSTVKPDASSHVLRWLPLTAAAAVVLALVGLLWIVSAPSAPTESIVSAEVTGPERVQPRPTATAAPSPTPFVTTPAGDTEAPDFRGIVQWLNSEPLKMEEQRGKVVLIDFWTYS